MKQDYLNQYSNYLKVKNLSVRTIKTYSSIVARFLDYCDNQPINVSDNDILKFVLTASASRTREQIIGSLQHFYFGVVKYPRKLKFIPKVKREQFIPNILTKQEAIQLIDSYSNKKHQAVISLIYYGGLRISEGIHLKIENIGKDGVIKICMGKGAKDRLIPLTPECITHLRIYYKKYRPTLFLFKGQSKETYSPKSIQNVLEDGLGRIGVTKHIRVHDLRHSRATHLLDAGVDIEFVRRFLGHKKLETTQRYIHTSVASMKRAILMSA